MSVDFTEEARADLRDIEAYIAGDNPARAESFVLELIATCKRLPQIGTRLAAIRGQARLGLRKFTVGKYMIIFRAKNENVQILRVVHGARSIPAILSKIRLRP